MTGKQYKFCEYIVQGYNAKDAYLSAYQNNSNTKTAYNEGAKLLNRKDIQEEIEKLREPLKIQATSIGISKLDEQINFIKSRIEICKINEDEQSIIRYTDMLNKIYGIYKDQPDTTDKQDKMIDIDTNTLKLLVNG